MCATGECHGCSVLAEPAYSGAAQARAIAADSRREADATTAALMADVSEGLRVLVTRDRVALTEAQIRDRAANIVSGLVGNFRIERLDGVCYARPAVTEQDFKREERIR